jgi:hypothetical protein
MRIESRIAYRGVEIHTLNTEEPAGAPYPGRFMFWDDDGDEHVVSTLDDARRIIDTGEHE